MTATEDQLTEKYVQDAFHSYLKSSLTQAKAEKLLDADMLSSAEGDLMITGPALCLYFAALRCTTNPPSVPLPRSLNKAARPSDEPQELSMYNCPPSFTAFLRVWSSTVQPIQSLAPEHQHDLARIICNLRPLQSNLPDAVNGISADLRAVAIEISQRRSFQERYGEDLQAALDAGGESSSGGETRSRPSVKASFVPPPLYDPSPTSSATSSPRNPLAPLPAGGSSRPATAALPATGSPLSAAAALPPTGSPRPAQAPLPAGPLPNPHSDARPQSPTHLAPPPANVRPSSRSSNHSPSSSTSSAGPSRSRTPSPFTSTISLIRETLYASLYEILSPEKPTDTSKFLHSILKTDPPRAYFACVSLAILDVSLTRLDSEGSVIGVLGEKVTRETCPAPLRPFLGELGSIARDAKVVEQEDNEAAMHLAARGRDIPIPRMDRVRTMLERGATDRGEGADADRRRSVEGRAVTFTNRIGALALGISRLPAFRERQNEVFKILGSTG